MPVFQTDEKDAGKFQTLGRMQGHHGDARLAAILHLIDVSEQRQLFEVIF